MTSSETQTRVLVVDDSAYTRRSISEVLKSVPGIQIAGKAADGEEALRLVRVAKPDVITLDLEMPRMDGYTFLRILMQTARTPVVVVSSHGQRENVFRALELGAVDFVVKPERMADADLGSLREELIGKVEAARRSTRRAQPETQAPIDARVTLPAPARQPPASASEAVELSLVVAIGSSTGGPTALVELFGRLTTRFRGAVLVAQHMPEKFTRTFSERLDRRSALKVVEAEGGEVLRPGTAFVCPGRYSMELDRGASGELRTRLTQKDPADRYVPSADRLLSSVARAVGPRALGVVLTGMGDDGALGAQAIVANGGIVVAESEASAVVYGMPGAAVRAGAVSRSMSVPEIADYLSLVGS